MTSIARPAARVLAPAVMLAGTLASGMGAHAMEANAAESLPDLMRLSIEELSNMEISSVSRRAEPVSIAPAAVFVITNDDIRQSGARTIPETLRLAPNLLVGRTDAIAYAISARGFNTPEASNKLLALMDGRSLYSPLHSGVFWENQDTVLDDIERIEVISGPGGTLWGANAVNGVINVITKSSRDTQGTFVKLGAGTVDQSGVARYGGRFSDALTYRAYVKAHRTGNAFTPAGVSADDSLSKVQGGFRTDWSEGRDDLTVQGDIYHGKSDHASAKLKGANALVTWTRRFEESQLRVKGYFDRTTRITPLTYDRVDSYDAELQHNFRLGESNEIVWGAGYRSNTENFINTPPFIFAQAKRTLEHTNFYVQDTYALTPELRFIAGVKFEHNQFTGWEIMPSGRIAWHAAEHAFLWAAVSRAVRTPSRIDRELEALPLLIPAANFASEEMLAYEIGYRGQLSPDVSVSISTYYNIYNDVRTTGASANGGQPLSLQNGRSAQTYGVEAWATYRVSERWWLDAGLNAMGKKTRIATGQVDLIPNQHLGNDPDFQASVRSTFFVRPDLDLSVALRTVDDLPSPVVPGYTEIDARMAWRALPNLEFAVSAENLLDESHPEVGDPASRREVRRSVFGTVRWSY
jgi:iron complex outermembrane receptor protein